MAADGDYAVLPNCSHGDDLGDEDVLEDDGETNAIAQTDSSNKIVRFKWTKPRQLDFTAKLRSAGIQFKPVFSTPLVSFPPPTLSAISSVNFANLTIKTRT